jgi:Zinc finger, C2H2 type
MIAHSVNYISKLKPYSCACGESFFTQKALKKHKIFFHREKKSKVKRECVRSLKKDRHYVCKCNREYNYKSKLAEHQQTCKIFLQHQKENGMNVTDANKNYDCPKCKRSFIRKQNLIRHQKSRGHLDKEQLKNMNVVCGKCEQKFFSNTALDKHLLRGSCLRNI